MYDGLMQMCLTALGITFSTALLTTVLSVWGDRD